MMGSCIQNNKKKHKEILSKTTCIYGIFIVFTGTAFRAKHNIGHKSNYFIYCFTVRQRAEI